MIKKETADKNRQAHDFIAGVGYIRKSVPKMPKKVIAKESACIPTATPSLEGSWHWLRPPQEGAPNVRMQWHPETKEWSPLLGHGKRITFSAAYLAAHGWMYVGFI